MASESSMLKDAHVLANRFLSRYPNEPHGVLLAFWDSLDDEQTRGSADVPMFIVNQPKCGLECTIRKSVADKIKDQNSLIPIESPPLILAITAGRSDVVSALISAGANINATRKSSKDTPLITSLYQGRLEITKLLIAHGAKVNTKGDNGITPLHLAAAMGELDVVKVLISEGADVNVADNDGQTPLYDCFSAYEADIPTLRVLLDAGADVNVATKSLDTPLHEARSLTNVTILLAEGADVNAVNDLGNTPLHEAIYRSQSGHVETIEKLVRAGARLAATNGNDEIPLKIFQRVCKFCLPSEVDRLSVLLTPGPDDENKLKSSPRQSTKKRGCIIC